MVEPIAKLLKYILANNSQILHITKKLKEFNNI
jgi:hypothetical protein